MDVPIHFVRTRDGCAIAYTVSGSGPPLVYLQPYTHQQFDQSHPVLRAWYQRLGRRHTLVRMDLRGFGLSDRNPDAISLDGFVRDVEAVVDNLGLSTFGVVGVSGQGYTAIKYAAACPERVSRVVTWATPYSGFDNDRHVAMRAVSELDPELLLDAQARWVAGDDPEQVPLWARHIRASVDAAGLAVYIRQLAHPSIDEDLAAMRCPCLVIFPSLHTQVTLPEVRELAARLPDAQFAVASGRVYPHLGPDIEATAKLLEEFLGEAEGPAGVPPHSGDRRQRNPHVAADLSAREMEVLRLLAAGRSNREIAAELVVSEHTVATHVHHVFQKTGLANRAEVAAYAVRNGLAD